MTILTRDQILNANDVRTEDVHVPEWGGTVRVRNLMGIERDEFETSIVGEDGTQRDPRNVRAKLVALSLVDEEGNRVFTMEDIEVLGRKSAGALDRVFGVAQRLSGLSPRDMEEIEKDLSFGQGVDSTSD